MPKGDMVTQEMLGTMQVKSLGNPKKVLEAVAADDFDTIVPLGTIAGYANGLSYRSNPNEPDVPSVALVGYFEGVSVDPSRGTLISTRCFLPQNIASVLVAALETKIDLTKKPKKAPAKGKGVDLTMPDDGKIPVLVEVGVKRSNSAVGYQYASSIRRQADDKIDPLADLRGDMAKMVEHQRSGAPLQIEDRTVAAKKKRR